jgi:hypothetical protein
MGLPVSSAVIRGGSTIASLEPAFGDFEFFSRIAAEMGSLVEAVRVFAIVFHPLCTPNACHQHQPAATPRIVGHPRVAGHEKYRLFRDFSRIFLPQPAKISPHDGSRNSSVASAKTTKKPAQEARFNTQTKTLRNPNGFQSVAEVVGIPEASLKYDA